jgi:hypothetical protein
MDIHWSFDEKHDRLLQEYSFSGGRIDVLCTFDNWSNLAVIEVKQGHAGPWAVKQLRNYLGAICKSPIAGPLGDGTAWKYSKENAIGILVAEGFWEISPAALKDAEPRIFPVQFNMKENKFPFLPVPDDIQQDPEEPEHTKKSVIYSFDEHCDYIEDEELKVLFKRLARSAIHQDDRERMEWTCENPKNDHVWVRYKGMGVVCLWAKKKHFNFGYGKTNGEWEYFPKITSKNMAKVEVAISEISKSIDQIDDKLARDIPPGFKWSEVLDD